MAHKVFICHSSKDKAIADAACAALEAKRISCWIAPRDILAGDEYGKSIIEALSTCEVVLLIFSRRSNDSPQCRREIERAVSKERIIVPFRIEDVMPSDAMEFALSNTHWLDAITPPLERRLNELCVTIGHLLQRQSVDKPVDTGGAAGVGSTADHPFPVSAASQVKSKRPLGLILGAAAAVVICALGIGGTLRYLHRPPAATVPPAPSPQTSNNTFVVPPPANPKPHVTTTPPKKTITGATVLPPGKSTVPTVPPVVDHAPPALPPAPPAMTPEQKARLDQVEMKIDDIGSGAESANNSLKQLQDQMSQQHLTLNGKWTELQAGMNNSLSKARAALKDKDADKAERYAATAASDLGQIKTFLGR